MSLPLTSRSPSIGPALPREGGPRPRSLRGPCWGLPGGWVGPSGSAGPPPSSPPQPGSRRLSPQSRPGQSHVGSVSGLSSPAWPWLTAVYRVPSRVPGMWLPETALPFLPHAQPPAQPQAQPGVLAELALKAIALRRETDVRALCSGRRSETPPWPPLPRPARPRLQ